MQINAFDELGRILSSGGESPIIFQADRGALLPVLITLVGERFPSLSSAERIFLAELAHDASAAGDTASAATDGPIIDIADVPVNPFVNESTTDRPRVKTRAIVSATNQDTGEKEYSTIDVLSGEIPDVADLRQQILDIIDKYAEAGYSKFGLGSATSIMDILVQIQSIQRRY